MGRLIPINFERFSDGSRCADRFETIARLIERGQNAGNGWEIFFSHTPTPWDRRSVADLIRRGARGSFKPVMWNLICTAQHCEGVDTAWQDVPEPILDPLLDLQEEEIDFPLESSIQEIAEILNPPPGSPRYWWDAFPEH